MFGVISLNPDTCCEVELKVAAYFIHIYIDIICIMINSKLYQTVYI